MAQSPPLHTPRLLLSSLSNRHLTEKYVGWLNDSTVTTYSQQRRRSHTLESCRSYMESFDGTPNYLWAMETREPALGHIGNITAYLDEDNSVADIGILLGEKSVWGKGYGGEAWLAVSDYLFRNIGVRKLTAGTLKVNLPMLALARSVGMHDDGVRVKQQLWQGQEIDVIHFAYFKTEWLSRFPDGPFPKA